MARKDHLIVLRCPHLDAASLSFNDLCFAPLSLAELVGFLHRLDNRTVGSGR